MGDEWSTVVWEEKGNQPPFREPALVATKRSFFCRSPPAGA
jgi:hypothetical protein